MGVQRVFALEYPLGGLGRSPVSAAHAVEVKRAQHMLLGRAQHMLLARAQHM